MTKTTFVESVGAPLGATREDGSYPVVLITPGQGTSGFYHESVIQEYAPTALPKGTHVYLDHLREGEERSPSKLLGYLCEDTTVDDEGNAHNRFMPLSKHREWIEEVKSLVGLSVAVAGEGRAGEVNGRKTVIVESLRPSVTNTVDMVSYAGRGGRFLESYLEEANQEEGDTPTDNLDPDSPEGAVEDRTLSDAGGTTKGNESMTYSEEQINSLISGVSDLVAKLTESAKAAGEQPSVDEDRAAAVDAVRAVESADISDATKARLLEGIKAGNYDVEADIEHEKALRESLREELRVELTESLGSGLGSSAGGASASDDDYTVKGW